MEEKEGSRWNPTRAKENVSRALPHPPRDPIVGLAEELPLPMTTHGATRFTYIEMLPSYLSSSHSSSPTSSSPSSSSTTYGGPSSMAARTVLRRWPCVAAASLLISRDDRLLQRALADAGRGAYGIGLEELWVLDGTTTGHRPLPPSSKILDRSPSNTHSLTLRGGQSYGRKGGPLHDAVHLQQHEAKLERGLETVLEPLFWGLMST